MSRLAIIDNQKIKHRSEKEYIQSLCPMNRTGSDCMYFEGEKLLIDEILCTGCGICVKAAPNAIKIINLPELSNKDPIHQFGQNGFRIFSLPLIQENSITGIIGRNGIGKSTIINILSNTTKANFAKFGEKEIKKDKEYFAYLNDLFKGTALQNYFNKLENKEIRVAYKPQQIINIPQIFNGKVIELLNKVSTDKKQIEKLCKELNIYNTLERDIKVVSGGELQRIAICAALLKDESNLFIFDEITNYLDIYERLNTSKLIKHKTKGKSAIVVEHDLIVLDYLADFVNIVYGEQGGYGMLTGIKAAKVGINNYLEGFSKEENVRFRDKSITFDKESAGEAQRIDILTTWEESQIKAGTFKLEIEKGNIKKGEIIGIIGRNALGKSTFIKHISEVGFGDEIVISYKPQLIPRDETTVMEYLMSHKNYDDNFYQIYVLDPLNIKPILEKPTNALSGGELQRFAIANCLLKEASLYLLDEPTAFLDIEDRLKISKMLKNFMSIKEKSAFIIDHDLVFMDYLSDKLQVFQGEPSIKGKAHTPLSMRDGMNKFLKELEITFRRDEANKRPRVNKENSVKDSEQKKAGEYYYA